MKAVLRIPNLGSTQTEELSFDGLSQSHKIRNTLKIPLEDKELVALPDGRAYRSMSRASLLISAVGLNLSKEIQVFVAQDPFSVGIYCAINNGPEDYNCARELLNTSQEDFAPLYKRLKGPKHYLKQLPNLAPAQLGIFLGICGPTNTFSHSRYGVLQALEHAESDLKFGKVKAALVCSAFAHEDLLLSFRSRMGLDDATILSEGAAALLLTQDDLPFLSKTFLSKNVLSKTAKSASKSRHFFGIADDLISLIQKENLHEK
jgi:hypothetical protein